MKIKTLAKTLILIITFFILSNPVFDDPSTRVIRLGMLDGTDTLAPAGVDQWIHAKRNRPLINGDRLWVDTESRAELQLGTEAVRLGSQTSISVLNITEKTLQLALDQGALNLHIWHFSAAQTSEIDTPNLALVANQSGDYRINVDTENHTTTVIVRHGQVIVYGEKNSYQIGAGSAYLFSGTDLNNAQQLAMPEADNFDAWCADRNHAVLRRQSSRHLSASIRGYDDLDNYGEWGTDDNYGAVWYPSNVAADWAPYREGEWVWIAPWGWTWVDEESWGFVPYHYGRWIYRHHRWGWIPGPIVDRPVYAPALVAFFGNISVGVEVFAGDNVGWVPLGPNDVYIPPYHHSRHYYNQINITNTTINQTIINNVYTQPQQPIQYQNLETPHALTLISQKAFKLSQPVNKNLIKLNQPLLSTKLSNTKLTTLAPVTPSKINILGTGLLTQIKPAKNLIKQNIIMKTTPPIMPVMENKNFINIQKPTTLQTINKEPLPITQPSQLKVLEKPHSITVAPQQLHPAAEKPIRVIPQPQQLQQPMERPLRVIEAPHVQPGADKPIRIPEPQQLQQPRERPLHVIEAPQHLRPAIEKPIRIPQPQQLQQPMERPRRVIEAPQHLRPAIEKPIRSPQPQQLQQPVERLRPRMETPRYPRENERPIYHPQPQQMTPTVAPRQMMEAPRYPRENQRPIYHPQPQQMTPAVAPRPMMEAPQIQRPANIPQPQRMAPTVAPQPMMPVKQPANPEQEKMLQQYLDKKK